MQGWFLEWLIQESGGYIPVWQNFVLDYPLNTRQLQTLAELKEEGLFCGAVPLVQHKEIVEMKKYCCFLQR